AVRFGVLQFPFFFAGIVLVQYFISLARFKLILLSSIVALAMKVIFSLLFSPIYSYSGIILASVPMYVSTNLLFLFFIIREKK
ncbi:MAG: polysaccharide biosynthesis C-terminal domain-containing protein, partial [Granulosicoccus sp.]|nr:polysaccharide biosynthesis C-terminal domain-containing protein [Granulosicoccus sp.]